MSNITSVIAICCNCSWRDEGIETARKNALKHSKKLNHTVTVEQAKSIIYRKKEK